MIDEVDSWYSCVVVAVSFVVYFMGYGVVRISGLFFSDIISFYKVDREQAATPFLMAAVAKSISGFGYGLSTTILPRVINLYTKQHATKANGIAMSGAPFAGIILPFITVALLNAYGMSGTFLNLSAIMLNTIPAVMLLRNPNFYTLMESQRVKDNFKRDIHKKNKTTLEEKTVSSESLEIGVNCETCALRDFKEHVPCEKNMLQDHTSFEELSVARLCEIRVKTEVDGKNKIVKIKDRSFDNPTENKSSTHKNHSLANKGCFNKTNRTQQRKSLSKCFPEPGNSSISKTQSCLNLFSIFWDPLFITFSFLKGFCALLSTIVPTIMADFSIDKGIDTNHTTYVLLAYSLADLFGRLCLGWITDGNHMSRVRFVALCFCIMAFSFVLMAWSNGFAVMTVAFMLEAMCVATSLPAVLVLVFQYFEKENQSMAIASLDISLLPLSFSAAPLIGYFRDHLGSYDGLAYTLSVMSLFCSILVLSVPSISKWKMKKKENALDVL